MGDPDRKKKTVAVAMSGGVDSSVAAAMLKEQGYDVFGMTMRLFCYGEKPLSEKSCCSLKAIADARAVCERIGAAHYVVDCEEVFEKEVIRRFVESYLSGLTPNPCVDCNSYIKFAYLLNKACKLGAQFLATGHYVRLLKPDNSQRQSIPLLASGFDPDKDQSYFLWGIPRRVLSSLLFPLGELRKAEVRKLAQKYGLAVSRKTESQEVCFVESSSVEEFVRNYGDLEKGSDWPHPNTQPGPLVDSQGRKLGNHRGSAFYTIGQRKRLGVALGRPTYVTSIDASTNTVVVGEKANLMTDTLEAAGVNYLVDPPKKPFEAQVKVRYRHTAVPAIVTPEPEKKITIRMERPQRAVTPGQSVVFYNGEVVLGGAVIGRVGVF